MRDSLWFQTASRSALDTLTTSDKLPRTADAVIVGAGIIGICTAYALVQAGLRNIAVLDRGHSLGQASGANAGGLWYTHSFPQLGALTGLALESSRLYDELAGSFRFDLRRNGVLELVPALNDPELRKTVQTTRAAGLAVETLTPQETVEYEPALAPGSGPALYFPQDGNVNPLKLAAALVAYLRQHGVRFCFGYSVEDVAQRIETPLGGVDCGYKVITCGAWTPLVTRVLDWEPPIRPMRGTLLALDVPPPTLRHTVMRGELYYWQLPEGHIAGGGTVEDEGFTYAVPDESVGRIRADMDSLLPSLRNHETVIAWSGFRPHCEDGLPVIGPVPEAKNTFVAAGHFKKGVMLAPATGQLIADLITTGSSKLPWDAVSPSRFSPEPALHTKQSRPS